MKKFFWVFLIPNFVWAAQPSPDVVQWVRSSLHPGIHVDDGGGRDSDCTADIVKISGADPVTNQPRAVTLAVYTPSTKGTPRDVLIFPPTGGETFIDRDYASALCGAGLRATILQSWDLDMQRDMDLATYDRAALRTLAAAEHALEYLNPQAPVEILGTSLGAIGASFVLGYDERIKTGVLIVGGDNLNEIIAHSDQSGVADVREKQMAANGLKTVEEYQAALGQAIHLNPGTFSEYSGAKNLSMYVGTEDNTVPTKNQWDLVHAWGNPKTDTYAGSHKETIFHTYLAHEEELVSFLAGKTVHLSHSGGSGGPVKVLN